MKRRITFWLLVGLFFVGVLIRIIHFPFRASAVMRVIPADAVFMSRHVAPADRVLAILASGFVDPFLTGGEGEERPGQEMADDPGFRRLVRLLGQRYVAAGYVAVFDGRPMPAFIVAAWVGGRITHLARLGFLDDVFSDFSIVRVDKNTRVWQGYFPDLPHGFRHVSFGLYEGVAFGVATDEPLGAAHLYQVMRRQAKSGASALLASNRDVIDPDIPDRLRIQNMFGSSVLFGPRFDAPDRLAVRSVISSIGSSPTSGVARPSALSDILAFIDRSSSFWIGTNAGRLLQLLDMLPLDPAVGAVAELFYTHGSGRKEDRAAVVWVADRDHGGRIMRLRVPAAGFIFEVEPGIAVTDILDAILLRIDRQYRVSWAYAAYGQKGVQVLRPPAGSWYAALPDGERLGVAVWKNYGFVHTSAQALDQLLAGFQAHAAVAPIALPEAASWFGKCDMPAASSVLRMGLSSYFLWQALQGQARDQAREARLLEMAQIMNGYSVMEAALHELPDGRGLAEVTLQRDGGN